MFGTKKIIGIGLGILASIGVIFGFLNGRKRRHKSMDEIEQMNQEMMELSDEDLTRMIKEMTEAIAAIDRWIGLDEFGINDADIEINRLNNKMFYYGYAHGGPYGSVDYMSREEKDQAWRRLMDILANNAKIAKIGP